MSLILQSALEKANAEYREGAALFSAFEELEGAANPALNDQWKKGFPKPHKGPQTDFMNSDADITVFGGAAGGGKGGRCAAIYWALENIPGFEIKQLGSVYHLIPREIKALDTVILGEVGQWIPFSLVEVGDRVMNPNGYPQSVTEVHENGEMQFYEVVFEGGQTVYCDGDHLWSVRVKRDRLDSGKPDFTRSLQRQDAQAIAWDLYQRRHFETRGTQWVINALSRGAAIDVPRLVPWMQRLIHGDYLGTGKRIAFVRPAGTSYSRCIRVSGANSLYVTDGYTVTHNTFGILMRAAQNIETPGFGATIFRPTMPEIKMEGGLWDEAKRMYKDIPGMRAIQDSGNYKCTFSAFESKISFTHADRLQDRIPGAQIAHIIIDELTKFEEDNFWFLLSRNRSACGVRPRLDATCNPDADSWVASLISWWIGRDGFPDMEKAGIHRYFYRIKQEMHWADTPGELEDRFPDNAAIAPPLSMTFIPSNVDDNPSMLKNNPQYKSGLLSLSEVEMERLLKGNWKIKNEAGKVFNRNHFDIVKADFLPRWSFVEMRAWDMAATTKEYNEDACYTAGVKMVLDLTTMDVIIVDMIAEQIDASEVLYLIAETAEDDGLDCAVRWEEEGGSSGKIVAETLSDMLGGFDVEAVKPYKNKLGRALPLARAARPKKDGTRGRVKMLEGDWNAQFLAWMHNFDGAGGKGKVNDVPDAASLCFNCLEMSFSSASWLKTV